MAGKKKELLLHIMSIYSVGFEPEIFVGTSLLTVCGGHYMPPPPMIEIGLINQNIVG